MADKALNTPSAVFIMALHTVTIEVFSEPFYLVVYVNRVILHVSDRLVELLVADI
jgi:hypothetical protein